MILLDKESLYYIISQNLYKLNPYVKYIQIDEVSPNRIKISKNFKLDKDGIISIRRVIKRKIQIEN